MPAQILLPDFVIFRQRMMSSHSHFNPTEKKHSFLSAVFQTFKTCALTSKKFFYLFFSQVSIFPLVPHRFLFLFLLFYVFVNELVKLLERLKIYENSKIIFICTTKSQLVNLEFLDQNQTRFFSSCDLHFLSCTSGTPK